MIKTTRPARRRAGFMLADLLALIPVVAVTLAFVLPISAAAPAKARKAKSSTHLRGIHQGLVVFGTSNKEYFVGLDSAGEILKKSKARTGNSGHGDTVQARYWILLKGDFISPGYAISPDETAKMTKYDAKKEAKVIWDKKAKNYSYAMLDIHGNPKIPTQVPLESVPRVKEWAMTLNSQAILISDRNTGTDGKKKVNSIYVKKAGSWKGNVLWGDNHVAMTKGHDQFATKYGNALLNADNNNGLDNIFLTNDTSAKIQGQTKHADARMVITGNTTVQTGE